MDTDYHHLSTKSCHVAFLNDIYDERNSFSRKFHQYLPTTRPHVKNLQVPCTLALPFIFLSYFNPSTTHCPVHSRKEYTHTYKYTIVGVAYEISERYCGSYFDDPREHGKTRHHRRTTINPPPRYPGTYIRQCIIILYTGSDDEHSEKISNCLANFEPVREV